MQFARNMQGVMLACLGLIACSRPSKSGVGDASVEMAVALPASLQSVPAGGMEARDEKDCDVRENRTIGACGGGSTVRFSRTMLVTRGSILR